MGLHSSKRLGENYKYGREEHDKINKGNIEDKEDEDGEEDGKEKEDKEEIQDLSIEDGEPEDTEDRNNQGACARIGCERQLLPYQNFFFWFYAKVGSVSVFFPLFYKQLGLKPWEIGLLMGVRPFAGFACAPLWGMMADKFDIHRQILYFCIFGFALFLVGFINVPPSPWTDSSCRAKGLICIEYNNSSHKGNLSAFQNDSCKYVLPDANRREALLESRDWMFERSGLHRIFTTMFILSVFGQVVDMPINYLAEAESLRSLKKNEMHKFGFIRRPAGFSLGIFSFSVGAVLNLVSYTETLCGLEVPMTHSEFAFYTAVGCLFFNFLSVVCFGKKPKANRQGKKVDLRRAFSVFLTVHYGSWLICITVIRICQGVANSFLFWHLENIGGSQLLIGIASAVLYLAHIIAYSLVYHLRRLIKTLPFMVIAILSYVIRFIAFAVIANPWFVIPVQLLDGFVPGMYLILVRYMSYAVPQENMATMLGILRGFNWGLGTGLGSVIGGQLVGAYGAKTTFWIVAATSGITLFLFTFAQIVSKRISLNSEEWTVEPDNETEERAQVLAS